MADRPQDAYRHLGPFSDLVAAAQSVRRLFPDPGDEVRARAAKVLGFSFGDETPLGSRTERRWSANGVDGEALSWSVGFGPRTQAYVLKPAGARGRLPGILALHDHGHFKFFGKEKIADGPEGPEPRLAGFRDVYYGGRAFANQLAREGFVVLVHDVFLWGSRRFPLDVMPERERALADAVAATLDQEYAGPEIAHYNGAAYMHEHLVSKYCTLLGTNIASIIAYEDRVALTSLQARDDVLADHVGCIGLSGGGLRSALLRATSDSFAACVIAGMMDTYEGLLDNCVAPHTWMLFPAGWSVEGDWPDLASSAAPAPLLVQYLLDDEQFTEQGMRGADARMVACYARSGATENYEGQFYQGPHRFDVGMQNAALAWLRKALCHLGSA
jgi:dienelactone hydrolase